MARSPGNRSRRPARRHPEDIIPIDRRYGYHLSKNITVRGDEQPKKKGQPQKETSDLSPRQQWIYENLVEHGERQKAEILKGYTKKFGLSKTSLERDMKVLRAQNRICFEGNRRSGVWRVV